LIDTSLLQMATGINSKTWQENQDVRWQPDHPCKIYLKENMYRVLSAGKANLLFIAAATIKQLILGAGQNHWNKIAGIDLIKMETIWRLTGFKGPDAISWISKWCKQVSVFIGAVCFAKQFDARQLNLVYAHGKENKKEFGNSFYQCRKIKPASNH